MKKKILLTLIFLSIALGGMFAQSVFQEHVYLKNGSIIKGIVLDYEEQPNRSIRVRTSDGSIFVYPIEDVVRVRKVMRRIRSTGGNNGRRTFTDGYRGYADVGYSFGLASIGGDYVTIQTSHGYQFSPHFFLGAGAGVNFYTGNIYKDLADQFDISSNQITLTPYVNGRYNIMNNDVSPYIDMKIGYTLLDVEGFYFSPSVGVSFALSSKFGLNVSLGYAVQLANSVDLGGDWSDWSSTDWNKYASDLSKTYSGLILKVGIEF